MTAPLHITVEGKTLIKFQDKLLDPAKLKIRAMAAPLVEVERAQLDTRYALHPELPLAVTKHAGVLYLLQGQLSSLPTLHETPSATVQAHLLSKFAVADSVWVNPKRGMTPEEMEQQARDESWGQPPLRPVERREFGRPVGSGQRVFRPQNPNRY